jgi:hypothetical protein
MWSEVSLVYAIKASPCQRWAVLADNGPELRMLEELKGYHKGRGRDRVGAETVIQDMKAKVLK